MKDFWEIQDWLQSLWKYPASDSRIPFLVQISKFFSVLILTFEGENEYAHCLGMSYYVNFLGGLGSNE